MANTNLSLHTTLRPLPRQNEHEHYLNIPGRSPAREAAEDFWASRLYFPALFAVAALFLLVGEGLAGAILLVACGCFMLLFCSNLLAALFPFLLTVFVTIDYYTDYRALLPYWYIAIPVMLSLLYHISEYSGTYRHGVGFRGLLLVSGATMLGGIGRISLQEYFRPLSLFYMLGLGVMLLLTYMAIKSQPAQGSRMLSRFLTILYVSGLFIALVIGRSYLMNLRQFLQTFAVQELQYRNFCATLLLMALPVPFFRALTRPQHLLGVGILYLALLMTGSRSGLLFGTLLVGLGIVYLLHYDRRRRSTYRKILLIAAVPSLLLGYVLISALFSTRMVDGNLISSGDSVRVEFLVQALRDFNNNFLFGQGLGSTDNRGIFQGTPGSMIFYHNAIAQIIGSMGLVGIVAYGCQFLDRIRLVFRKRSPLVVTAAMSYLGLLMVSMTNPGSFCPLPNALLLVILFTLLEDCPDRSDTVHPAEAAPQST